MDSILVKGHGALNGQIPIAGAKNTVSQTDACARLLTEEPLTLTNARALSDIRTLTSFLNRSGARLRTCPDGRVLALSCHGNQHLARTMTLCAKCAPRQLVLGPCWPREGEAIVSLPGGCAIGARRWTFTLMAWSLWAPTLNCGRLSPRQSAKGRSRGRSSTSLCVGGADGKHHDGRDVWPKARP